MRILIVLALGTVASVAPLLGQAPATPVALLSFQTVSIRPAVFSRRPGIHSESGGGVTANLVSARDLIRGAYGLPEVQLEGGPAWTKSDRFDMVAQAEREPTRDELRSMLQSLLADRFKLLVHRETKEQPIYVLTLASADGSIGAGLRRSPVDCAAIPSPCGLSGSQGTMTAHPIAFSVFARSLSPTVGRVVVDRTGLSGVFEFELRWSPEPRATFPGPSFFGALQEQLGLKLEPDRAPLEMLVIDHVEPPTPD